MGISAVIISDLHLGSTKSSIDQAAKPSDRSYEEFIQEKLLKVIEPHLKNGKAKFLILNGDTFDFSLQSYQEVFDSAGKFFKAIANSNMFEQIILIVGNHDHNLWQLLQHEVMVVRRVATGRAPLPYPHIQAGILDLKSGTLKLPGVEGGLGDIFLKGLFQPPVRVGVAELPIAVVYPNLFILTSDDVSRPTLVTHGHFFCLPWILLTEVFPKVLGIDKGFRLDELEQINSPLTEFGWTALGQAGRLTKVVEQIYQEGLGHSTKTAERALDELTQYLDENVFKYSSLDVREWFSDGAVKFFNWAIKKLLSDKIVGSSAHKGNHLFLNNSDNQMLINKYLSMTRAQYSKLVPDNVTASIPSMLIFGHTHVPIWPGQAVVSVQHQGANYEVKAINTGGFMKDTEAAEAICLVINSDTGVDAFQLWKH